MRLKFNEFFYENDPDLVGVPLGGLEQDPESMPVANIFVGSKALWYQLTEWSASTSGVAAF